MEYSDVQYIELLNISAIINKTEQVFAREVLENGSRVSKRRAQKVRGANTASTVTFTLLSYGNRMDKKGESN